MAILIGLIFAVGLFIILTAYSYMSWGYVAFKFWYWFLVPIFPQVPPITYWMAVGLTFFLMLFKNHNSETIIKDEYKDKSSSTVVMSLLTPWLTLLMGYMMLVWFIR